MDVIVKNWIKNSRCDNIKTCNFCQHVGLVACGIKPAAIISISKDDFQRLRQLETRISVKVIARAENKFNVFVYNRWVLFAVLRDDACRRILFELGYTDFEQGESLVQQLLRRIQRKGDFPHEIGIFLGYPLKDVCGFMGINQLKLTKRMGWNMYGDTAESEKLYWKQKKLRQQIGQMLNQSQYLTV